MKYRLIKVNPNPIFWDCSDLYIEDTETGEVLVADAVKIWEDDQESLEEMFEAVKNGEWE